MYELRAVHQPRGWFRLRLQRWLHRAVVWDDDRSLRERPVPQWGHVPQRVGRICLRLSARYVNYSSVLLKSIMTPISANIFFFIILIVSVNFVFLMKPYSLLPKKVKCICSFRKNEIKSEVNWIELMDRYKQISSIALMKQQQIRLFTVLFHSSPDLLAMLYCNFISQSRKFDNPNFFARILHPVWFVLVISYIAGNR